MDYKKLAAGTPKPYSFPTAQEVFGPDPWIKNPTGSVVTTGATYPYNPYYFATPEAAKKVAELVGGVVVESNNIAQFGPFRQSHPNQMIQLPNGRMINAGLFMSFWDHGYEQHYIDMLVESELS